MTIYINAKENQALFVMTKNKVSRGRPVKDDSEKKTEKVEIRLTATEKKNLQVAAGDLSLSQWARSILFKEAGIPATD